MIVSGGLAWGFYLDSTGSGILNRVRMGFYVSIELRFDAEERFREGYLNVLLNWCDMMGDKWSDFIIKADFPC